MIEQNFTSLCVCGSVILRNAIIALLLEPGDTGVQWLLDVCDVINLKKGKIRQKQLKDVYKTNLEQYESE